MFFQVDAVCLSLQIETLPPGGRRKERDGRREVGGEIIKEEGERLIRFRKGISFQGP